MPEIILQDGRDSIHLVCLPEAGCVHLKTVDVNGFTKRRDLFDIADHPELADMHTPSGWYMPAINKALALYTKPRHKALPWFIIKHYGGRS